MLELLLVIYLVGILAALMFDFYTLWCLDILNFKYSLVAIAAGFFWPLTLIVVAILKLMGKDPNIFKV